MISYSSAARLLTAFTNKGGNGRLNIVQISLRRSSTHTPLTVLNNDEEHIKTRACNTAIEKIAPFVDKMDKEHRMEPQVIEALFHHKLMGIEIPTKYGGLGLNFTSSIIALQEIAKVDLGTSVSVHVQNTLVNNMILKYGTQEQKVKYLPKLAQDTIGCFALSESEAGSDGFSMKTHGKKDGSNYILNGSKSWISSGPIAGIFIVVAKTDQSQGHSCFILEKGIPGLRIGMCEDTVGIRSSPMSPLYFDNVCVPSDHVLGEIGNAFKYVLDTMNGVRVGVGAQMLGVAEACMDLAVPHLQLRKQFNQRLYEFQAIKHQLARIATDIECSRLLVSNACRLKEAGLPYAKEASMAKYYSAEVASLASSKCLELMGAMGYTKGGKIEKLYRDCKSGTIYGGTINIQLNNVARIVDKHYKS